MYLLQNLPIAPLPHSPVTRAAGLAGKGFDILELSLILVVFLSVPMTRNVLYFYAQIG